MRELIIGSFIIVMVIVATHFLVEKPPNLSPISTVTNFQVAYNKQDVHELLHPEFINNQLADEQNDITRLFHKEKTVEFESVNVVSESENDAVVAFSYQAIDILDRPIEVNGEMLLKQNNRERRWYILEITSTPTILPSSNPLTAKETIGLIFESREQNELELLYQLYSSGYKEDIKRMFGMSINEFIAQIREVSLKKKPEKLEKVVEKTEGISSCTFPEQMDTKTSRQTKQFECKTITLNYTNPDYPGYILSSKYKLIDEDGTWKINDEKSEPPIPNNKID
ncbi:hypothetical protein [Bacillus sp. PS06]|uniref:hypothetical protein n=1 Tax=Bacillus sp. PS06 TaxID=2764176 RepID=UPI00177AF7A9|nr:hypothetical protein [Bacillus sp. PS06]MBD8069823.1 hypothetical protein [Bacillus sp. PS06]